MIPAPRQAGIREEISTGRSGSKSRPPIAAPWPGFRGMRNSHLPSPAAGEGFGAMPLPHGGESPIPSHPNPALKAAFPPKSSRPKRQHLSCCLWGFPRAGNEDKFWNIGKNSCERSLASPSRSPETTDGIWELQDQTLHLQHHPTPSPIPQQIQKIPRNDVRAVNVWEKPLELQVLLTLRL